MASTDVNEKNLDLSLNESNKEDISVEAQQYLDSDEIRLITDPKLKREKKKLNELLESYRKLIEKLESKFENEDAKLEHRKKLEKIPEIYAILHPELYKNPREEEKKHLISKFSKKQFSEVDKIIKPVYRTPPSNLNDVRQEEKERLIRILSSCPARFLNPCDGPISTKKYKRSQSYSLSYDSFKNQREAEKERLSRILATSTTYYRKHLDANIKKTGRRTEKNIQKLRDKCFEEHTGVNENEQISTSSGDKVLDMVRVGEYSPLSSKGKSQTLFGYGEHEERRNQLLAERRKEYKQYLTHCEEEKVDKGLSKADNDEEEKEDTNKRSRCHSISTQTDDLPLDSNDGNECESVASHNNGEQTSPRKVYYLSPREKLMSDLHGDSHCFPGGAVASIDKTIDGREMRLRQAAYAKALQDQINEKRKFEEDRRRKEREEDELIEQRIRMQQEKMKSEVSNEQKKKQDWMAQRQSQEEILRRKMLEMKLETQELIKQQNRKKREPGSTFETKALPNSMPKKFSEPLTREGYIKPHSSPDSSHNRDLTGRVSLRSLPTRMYPFRKENNVAGRGQSRKYDPIERAPLLDADRQNILKSISNYTISPHLPNANLRSRGNASLYDVQSSIKDREKAEEMLRAPLDIRINRPVSPAVHSSERPPSPPIPALRTRDIINNNTKVLEDKWKIPGQGRDLNRTLENEDKILTQLGAFRRQLQQEHMKLEARLHKQAST